MCAGDRVEAVTALDILYNDFHHRVYGLLNNSGEAKSCGMNYTCPDGEHLCQTRYYPQLINRKVTFPNIMVSLAKVVVGTLRTLVRKYTAVSRKAVLQTGKSLRDNVESYYGQ